VTIHLRKFIIALFLALLMFLSVAPVIGQSVKIKSNSKRAISTLGKYAWRQNKIAVAQTPEVAAEIDRKIKDAVNRELARKGFIESQQNPDFLVQVATYGVPEMLTSANPDVTNPFGNTVYTQTGGPGVSLWMAVISNVSFILTESSSSQVLWQADATKKYKDPQKVIRNLDKEIQNVVGNSLKALPAHK